MMSLARRYIHSRAIRRATASLFWAAAILSLGAIASVSIAFSKTLYAPAITAAIESSALPNVVPDFVQYEHGTERRVSSADQSRGVVAYYSVAINYKATDVTLGLTYRIFRNHHAAALYAKRVSVFESPGFKPAAGFALAETNVSSPNKWPGRSPYKSAVCDFFASAASPDLATARCSAVHADLPVIVSGIRVETVQFNQSGKRVTYRLRQDQKYSEYGYAMELLDTGMARLEDIENTGR